MNVRMNTTSAGPNGVRRAGQVYNVSKEEGKALIDGNYATVAAGGEEAANVDPAENASRQPKEKRDRIGKVE